MATLIGKVLVRETTILSNRLANIILNRTDILARNGCIGSLCSAAAGVNLVFKSGLRSQNSSNTVDKELNKDFSTATLPIETQQLGLNDKEQFVAKAVIEKINNQIVEKSYGRLFAVIQIAGKQFKVTNEDIIIVQSHIAPEIGQRIRLEKILLLGCKDFTLIGRPILSKDLARIEATVFEKALSHMKTIFRFKKRKNYRRMRSLKTPYTMLRINTIELTNLVNEKKDIEGIDDVLL